MHRGTGIEGMIFGSEKLFAGIRSDLKKLLDSKGQISNRDDSFRFSRKKLPGE